MDQPSGRVSLITGGPRPAAVAIANTLAARGERVVIADRRDAIGRAIDRFGRLDQLVNVVPGGVDRTPLMELDPLALREDLQHTLAGPLVWIQRAYWLWMAERGGSIVNVTTGGRRAERSAAHAALVRLTESLSTELAPRIDVRLADVAELVTRREPGAGRRARPDPPAAGEVA